MIAAIVILFVWNILLTIHYVVQMNTIADNFMTVKTVIINVLKRERDVNDG